MEKLREVVILGRIAMERCSTFDSYIQFKRLADSANRLLVDAVIYGSLLDDDRYSAIMRQFGLLTKGSRFTDSCSKAVRSR